MLKSIVTIATGIAALTALSSASDAAPRYRHPHRAYYVEYTPAPDLTINKRSFLDAGVVAPVGTENRYVAESTTIDAPYVVRDLLHQKYDGWRISKLSVTGPEPQYGPLFPFETPGIP